MLQYKAWQNQERYTLTNTNAQVERVYYYDNYVATFVNGKCYHIRKYPNNIEGGNPAILSRNFMYKKIESRTLNEPPEELLNAIKNMTTHNEEEQQDWLIDEKHLDIKN